MALELDDLQARLADLLKLRYGGESEIMTRTLDAEERVRFKSDKDLTLAIADCERRIAKLQGGRIHTVRIAASKGL